MTELVKYDNNKLITELLTVCKVFDNKRHKYYPRYTMKGVRMVEDLLLEKGYKLKV